MQAVSADLLQFTGSDLAVALTAIAVMALASAFQAAVGFGLALFAVPLLAVLDPLYVPGPMLLAGSVQSFVTARRDRHALDLPGLRLSLVGLAVGTVIGALSLKAVSGPALPKVFGVLVLLAVLVSIFGPPIRATATSLSVAGLASGIMGTMSGIHAAIALVYQNAEPAVARAMLGAYFAIAYLVSVAALAAVGLFGWPHVMRAVILLPGVWLGLLAAPSIALYVDRTRLRWAILIVSSISALILLTR